ncbi:MULTISPECIES: hypothetical protein [unclassified Geodermatophilus]
MTEQPYEQPPLSDEAQAEARQAIDESAALAAGVVFAVVDGNGTLARGSGAVSATKLADGAYEVIFNRNIRRGAFLCTIGLSADAGASPPGEVIVNLRVGTSNGVFVLTHDSTGKVEDRSFHLAVILP